MKFQLAATAGLLSTAAALNATNMTSTATYTDLTTTVVTITHCEENICSTQLSTAAQTVVTETVQGVETIYTTYCPLPSQSEETTYVDTTTTPVAPVSTEGELTVTIQSTIFTSLQNATTTPVATVSSFEGAAVAQQAAAGFAAVAGLAAVLL